MSTRDVVVPLGPRTYRIRIVHAAGPQLPDFVRASLATSWSGRDCRQALVVVDSNLSARSESVCDALGAAGLAARSRVVPCGEASKSIENAQALWNLLVEIKADRHTLMVALGGGVIGDLAGFVAATFARGLPLLMIPTSLLAQVDSAIGGKVAINHSAAKNSIGAFHQPIGVWIDVDTLDTLPDRELRCGLAEVVKYGVIEGAPLFERIERDAGAILGREPAVLMSLIEECCRIKSRVVAGDEREETGARAVLNFGHTVGHAIEAVAGYDGPYKHGEAVALGMVAESRMAQRLGWIDQDSCARLVALLDRLGLPTTAPALPADRLTHAMQRDKKNRGGSIHFVLPRRFGQVELTDRVPPEVVRFGLDSVLRQTP